MAMPKLAEVTFYGISVLDGSLVSMFLLSTCPRLQLCRALILAMSFNPPIKQQFLRSCGLSRRQSRGDTRQTNCVSQLHNSNVSIKEIFTSDLRYLRSPVFGKVRPCY